MKTKDIEPYILPAVVVLFGLYFLKKFKLPGQAESEQTGKDIQASGQQPSYTDTSYNNLADRIESAVKSHIFTDKDGIFDVFKLLKKDVDFLKLIKAFGQRRMQFTLAYGDLGAFLGSVLNSDDMNQVNSIMAANGLKSRI